MEVSKEELNRLLRENDAVMLQIAREQMPDALQARASQLGFAPQRMLFLPIPQILTTSEDPDSNHSVTQRPDSNPPTSAPATRSAQQILGIVLGAPETQRND
jgi:hypothetical protein